MLLGCMLLLTGVVSSRNVYDAPALVLNVVVVHDALMHDSELKVVSFAFQGSKGHHVTA